jgi:hypothetical protein
VTVEDPVEYQLHGVVQVPDSGAFRIGEIHVASQ